MAKTTSTALRQSSKPDPKTIEGFFSQRQASMARALQGSMTPERMLSLTLTELRRNPKLRDCTPQSLFSAVLQAGQLGLEPSGTLGHAYLVPYKQDCQLIIGYRGMIELALRTGKVKSIMARCVYANDEFVVHLGTDESISHIPELYGERGDLVAVYAVAHMRDGGVEMDVLPREKIEDHRRRSMAKDSGPWKTDYDEMARKTVIRTLFKYLPASAVPNTVVEQIEEIERGITFEGELAPEPPPEKPPETASEPPQAVPTKPKAEAKTKSEPAPAPQTGGVTGSTKAGPLSERGDQIRRMIRMAHSSDFNFIRDLIKEHAIGDEQAVLNDLLEDRALSLAAGESEPVQQEIE